MLIMTARRLNMERVLMILNMTAGLLNMTPVLIISNITAGHMNKACPYDPEHEDRTHAHVVSLLIIVYQCSRDEMVKHQHPFVGSLRRSFLHPHQSETVCQCARYCPKVLIFLGKLAT